MKKVQVRLTRSPDDSIPVGELAEDSGRVYFEYAADFLATGLDLSPFRLPFEPGLFEHTDREFGPLPGLFDDSLPDGWGLGLMDRHFRKLGLEPGQVGPLDRLAWLGTRTMGALTYHPPAEREETDAGVFDLHDLARHSQEILAGRAADVLPQLLRAGGSPSGARPKVLVGLNIATAEVVSGEDDLPEGLEHWIVKFAAREDAADAGPVEQAYSLMARVGGIDMPPSRLFETADGESFFGVKRFDRAGNRRSHVHSFGNMIHADFRVPGGDYADLLKAAWVLTQNHQEVLKAFRRMAFNVLAHNRDDHVKNFAFVLDDSTGQWSLSPAYDLTCAPGPGGEHTMTVHGEGRRPTREDMLALGEQAGIAHRRANAIIDEVRAGVSRWRQFADQAHVAPAVAARIAERFPPG